MVMMRITAEPLVPQMVIRSEHAAPRELMSRTFIDPQLLAQWLGPPTMAMTVDRLNARDGGQWRLIHQDAADGGEYAFYGVRLAPVS